MQQQDYTEKRKEGSFYTPKVWGELAYKYIEYHLQHDKIADYLFYDCCAGEGNLLDVLPTSICKFASTLHTEYVQILKDKGYDAIQYDFLQDNITELINIVKQKQIENNRKGIICFTNPPFLLLKKEQYSYIKNKYKSNDAVLLFIYRIIKEFKVDYLALFSKIPNYATKDYVNLQLRTRNLFFKNFLTRSKGWGLKGDFAISFMMYDNKELLTEQDEIRVTITYDIWQINAGKPKKVGEKMFFPYK